MTEKQFTGSTEAVRDILPPMDGVWPPVFLSVVVFRIPGQTPIVLPKCSGHRTIDDAVQCAEYTREQRKEYEREMLKVLPDKTTAEWAIVRHSTIMETMENLA